MAMVQYGVWPNCCNACKFCLRLNRDTWSTRYIIRRIRSIRKNIKTIDWKNDFKAGISLLGGELYFMTDEKIQNEFLLLIDDIIEFILKPNPRAVYSTVTNGLYDPTFLFKVLDKIKDAVGIKRIDINFSYDIKYRYDSKAREQLCIENAKKVIQRYNYKLSVQTILTQYLIDAIMKNEFNIDNFEKNVIPGCQIAFLYPHPINPKLPPLDDFMFNRHSFLEFIKFLSEKYPMHLENFYCSVENSGVFKYTGMRNVSGTSEQKPILSDGKEKLNPICHHSTLYQCYSDSDNCMLCDLKGLLCL